MHIHTWPILFLQLSLILCAECWQLKVLTAVLTLDDLGATRALCDFGWRVFCAGEIQENHGGVLLGLDIFRISSQSLLIDCFTMLNRLFSYSTCNSAGNCQVATMPGSRGCAWTLSYRHFLWFCSFWAWSLRASIFWTLADERLMVVEQWKPWEIDEKSLLTMVIFHFANCNKLPKDIMISESSIYNVWTLKLTAYTCCSSLMA